MLNNKNKINKVDRKNLFTFFVIIKIGRRYDKNKKRAK